MAEQKFEDALSKLESIVDQLEAGDLNLDDAIKKYEEGMQLYAFCSKKLAEIKKKVEVLVKEPSGKLVLKDFKTAADAGEKSIDAKPSPKKRPKGESLLF